MPNQMCALSHCLPCVWKFCFTGLTAKTTLQTHKVRLNQLPRLVHFAIVEINLVHWKEYQMLTIVISSCQRTKSCTICFSWRQ